MAHRQSAYRVFAALVAGGIRYLVVRAGSGQAAMDATRWHLRRLGGAADPPVHLSSQESPDRSGGGVLDHPVLLWPAAACVERPKLAHVGAGLGGGRLGHDYQGRGHHRLAAADPGRYGIAARLAAGARACAQPEILARPAGFPSGVRGLAGADVDGCTGQWRRCVSRVCR